MNPLLVLQVASIVRDKVREHPARWGCVALFLVFGPPLIGVLVVSLLIMVLAGGSGESIAAPQHVPGIPDIMLAAYTRVAQRITALRPECTGLRWSILAGIAQEESQHAAGHTIAPNGDITPPILGPALDGSGSGGNYTPIRNSDGTFARAIGPFQFLTTTWTAVAQDGNDDGIRNPNNAFDAALGAAVYLCGDGPRNLAEDNQLRAAIFHYNASPTYVDKVVANIRAYDAIPLQAGRRVSANATGEAKKVIDAAMAQRGVSYAWGGGTANGPSRGIHDGGVADQHGDYNKIGFDCSGLTLYAYAKIGISLPRTAAAQFTTGIRIPKEAGLAALKPADLVFYSPGLIHHVGIYLGNGQMVNAFESGTVVRVDTVNLADYAGAVRLLN